jgi:hypothetical protein
VLLEDVIEIPDGLVKVKSEREADRSHGLTENQGPGAPQRSRYRRQHVGE